MNIEVAVRQKPLNYFVDSSGQTGQQHRARKNSDPIGPMLRQRAGEEHADQTVFKKVELFFRRFDRPRDKAV